MIFKISWRNIWRNPMRSFVVMGAIIVGVWSIVFLSSMMYGMIDGYVDNAINNEVSHIQIHHKGFPKDKESKFYIEEGEALLAKCEAIEGVKAVSIRSLTNAMIASSKSTRGIRVSGVIPNREKEVTGVASKIIEGEYLSDKGRSPVLVSKKTAEKLKLKMRSKIVLTFQDLKGNITAGAFRVTGIFETGNNMYDESIVFVRQQDLNGLLGENDIGHEVAIILDDIKNIEETKTQIITAFPNLFIQSYKEIAPELELFQSQIKMGSTIYMVIFMLALIFGIINTMLMTVLERFRELGVLMAVGMDKGRVFFMIVSETLMLALIAAPVGLLIAYFTVQHFSKTGVNLFFYSEDAMKQFGMSTFIYPSVDTSLYAQLAVAVGITALLASLYPAYKAISLKPVEALHKI